MPYNGLKVINYEVLIDKKSSKVTPLGLEWSEDGIFGDIDSLMCFGLGEGARDGRPETH